jgi:uncharacterized membrane protein
MLRTKMLVCALALAALPTAVLPTAVRADLSVCNRTSYLFDLALGLETKDGAATRGWFRIDPGSCRVVLSSGMEANRMFIHVRPLALYPDAPLSLARHADLCIAQGNFVVAGARRCPSAGQFLAPFAEVKPSGSEQGRTVRLAEEADYSEEQARLAAVQRLLVIAGYDAEPIDGIEGPKTESAIAQFLREHKLPADIEASALLEALVKAARPDTGGLSWCNDTKYAVMAALGSEEKGAIVTRGWYRVPAGGCLRAPTTGKPGRLYSFGEAVDDAGRAVRQGDKPLAWGGAVVLCTREAMFEIADHRGCAQRGLNATGFAAVEGASPKAAVVRFRE